MALASFANPDTLIAYPSTQTLAAGLRKSSRTVQRTLRVLEADRHIEALDGHVGGRGHATRYRLICLERVTSSRHPLGRATRPERVTPQAIKGDTTGVKGDRAVSPEEMKSQEETSSPCGVDVSPPGTDARDAPTTGAQQGLPDDGARKGNSERTRRQSFCIRGALCPGMSLVHVEGGGDQPGEDEQARGGAHYRGDGEPCTRCYNAGWRNCPSCRDKAVLRMDRCRRCSSEKGGGGGTSCRFRNDGGGGCFTRRGQHHPRRA